MSKQFWLVIVAVAVILGGIFWVSSDHTKKTNTASNVGPTSHIEGKGSTGVTLVEYGDYECPFCGQFEPYVEQVFNQYKDKIYFQFRNFPLTNVHPNAMAAARAAEAAGLQGKFWEMHDKLYANQDPNGQSGWVASSDPRTYFDQFAQQLGLNMTEFNTDYASSKVDNMINADIEAGNKLNITGTPTFYLDGKQIQPGYSVDSFKKFIDPEIAQKTADQKPAATTSKQ